MNSKNQVRVSVGITLHEKGTTSTIVSILNLQEYQQHSISKEKHRLGLGRYLNEQKNQVGVSVGTTLHENENAEKQS